MTHDDKGFSEEKCLRCGWVMGHEPLNCNNDDTPHIFPSQLRARSEWPGFPDARAAALIGEFDAMKWAEGFQEIVIDGGLTVDKELMLGWFANAIMAGHDYARHHPSTTESTVLMTAEERELKPFSFSYHRKDGGYTEDPEDWDALPLPLEEAVFQALGYASMCWSETPTGVFDSTAAKSAGDALIAYVEDML